MKMLPARRCFELIFQFWKALVVQKKEKKNKDKIVIDNNINLK